MMALVQMEEYSQVTVAADRLGCSLEGYDVVHRAQRPQEATDAIGAGDFPVRGAFRYVTLSIMHRHHLSILCIK